MEDDLRARVKDIRTLVEWLTLESQNEIEWPAISYLAERISQHSAGLSRAVTLHRAEEAIEFAKLPAGEDQIHHPDRLLSAVQIAEMVAIDPPSAAQTLKRWEARHGFPGPVGFEDSTGRASLTRWRASEVFKWIEEAKKLPNRSRPKPMREN